MAEQHQETGPQIPVRFGAQILPPLGGSGVEKVVCGLVSGLFRKSFGG